MKVAMMVKQLSLCCVFFSLMHAHAQEGTRPTHKVGDKWLVERLDLSRNEAASLREHRVAGISNSSRTLEAKDPDSGNVTTRITDLVGNTLETEGRKFDSPIMDYSFPLAVGKKWKHKYSAPGRSNPTNTVTAERECEVLAHEDVVTKAGTFKSYKIKCDGIYTGMDGSYQWHGQAFSTRWYSPAVRYFVKHEYKYSTRHGIQTHYVDELVSFELQK